MIAHDLYHCAWVRFHVRVVYDASHTYALSSTSYMCYLFLYGATIQFCNKSFVE